MERTFVVQTELETLLVEQALAMAGESQSLADAAPDGKVLAGAELAAVRSGRERPVGIAGRRLARYTSRNFLNDLPAHRHRPKHGG